jgi:hypothetical protein
MYWGCADRYCLKYGIAVAYDQGTVSAVEVEAWLGADAAKALFAESDLPKRVLGLREEQVTAWVGRPPTSLRLGRVQWDWAVDGATVRMSVVFQAGLSNAATWHL